MSFMAILFTVFSIMFAGFMAADFFEAKFDLLGLSALALAGISLLLAILTFVIHRFYGQNNPPPGV